MRKLRKTAHTSKFAPDYMAKSVLDIDFKALQKAGIKYVAFDADSTLVQYKEKQLSKKTQDFLKTHKNSFIDWAIASNRTKKTLMTIAAELDAEIVAANYMVRKPRKAYFKKLIRYFDAKPEQIAMVGDKLLADVWGGNRMGLTTVWVERIGPDNIVDKIFATRQIEAWLMRHYV